MKIKLLMLVLNSYLEKTEILQMGRSIKKVVNLEPVFNVDPPTKIGLIVINPVTGIESRVVFKKTPEVWKGIGYSWKLDIEWFKREYNKITPETLYSKLKEMVI